MQRMFKLSYNCTHFPCSKSFKLGFSSMCTKNSRCTSWICKRQRNQGSNCQHTLDHRKREFQKNIYFCFSNYAKAFGRVNHSKLWKILRDGNSRPLYLSSEKSYAGQEAIIRTRHEIKDQVKIEKGVHQGCTLSFCLLNFNAEYIT